MEMLRRVSCGIDGVLSNVELKSSFDRQYCCLDIHGQGCAVFVYLRGSRFVFVNKTATENSMYILDEPNHLYVA